MLLRWAEAVAVLVLPLTGLSRPWWLAAENGEGLQILRYVDGEKYEPHTGRHPGRLPLLLELAFWTSCALGLCVCWF